MVRGDPGINPLDAACKEHDIAYDKHSKSEERAAADKKLQMNAFKRVFSKDASFGERLTALGVSAAMKAKRMLTKRGGGITKRRTAKMKKKQISFQHVVRNAKSEIKKVKPDTIDSALKLAIKSIQRSKKGNQIRPPRVIKVPAYSGGILPLIPLFAGLSALGAVGSSTVGIVNAINQYRKAQNELDENKRHNRSMEAIALGKKSGAGYYLCHAKTGDGYFLKPYSKNE